MKNALCGGVIMEARTMIVCKYCNRPIVPTAGEDFCEDCRKNHTIENIFGVAPSSETISQFSDMSILTSSQWFEQEICIKGPRYKYKIFFLRKIQLLGSINNYTAVSKTIHQESQKNIEA